MGRVKAKAKVVIELLLSLTGYNDMICQLLTLMCFHVLLHVRTK